MRLLNTQYSQPNCREWSSGLPRIIIFDQFTGHLAAKVIRRAVELRKIPLVIFGGLTGILRPADAYQIQKLKARYRVHEQIRLTQYQAARPNAVPQMQGQDVVTAGAKQWLELTNDEDYVEGLRRTFGKNAILR